MAKNEPVDMPAADLETKPEIKLQPTVEEHAAELKTDPFFFAFAKAFNRWPEMLRMSRADFEKKIDEAANRKFQG